MLKRSFDLAAAALLALILMPLGLLIAASIALDDGGPVLFTQTRLGRNRTPFRIYKFRSMRGSALTRIGRRLRATGADEIPQLLNVLRGNMSLIGPRPLTGPDVERLGWDDSAHELRWRVKPGITGLAQLYAGRGARLSWFLDRRYVEVRSAGLELRIVLLTAAIGVLGKKRVRARLRRGHRPSAPASRPTRTVALAGPCPARSALKVRG